MKIPVSKIRPIAKRHGITRLRVFGSYAKGTETPESDIDLLVDFTEVKSLFQMSKIQAELSQALGKNIDMGLEKCLRPHVKDDVLKHAKLLLVNKDV